MGPTALSTTKRKFHKLLDSISSNSSTTSLSKRSSYNASTTTLPVTVESPAKRPRVTHPVSVYVSAASHASKRSNTQATTANADRKPPNYAPWDRVQFLERLKTFRHVDKWTAKPDPINEVQWAKRGWKCVGKDRIGCLGGCEKEVVIKLGAGEDLQGGDGTGTEDEDTNNDWREDAERELVDRYAEMIVTEHEEGCLWKRKGCDDSIHRLPLASQATALVHLQERYHSLTQMSPDLPFALSTPPNFDITQISPNIAPFLQEVSQIPTTTTANITITEKPNHEALILALFGWQAEENHLSGLATCSACFRRLGLWLFKPRPVSAASNSSEGTEPSMTRLDVVAEHRDYCPWINAESQGRGYPSGAEPGWKILLRAVQNASASRRNELGSTISRPASANGTGDGDFSDVASMLSTAETRAERDEKDKERFAKLKRLKKAFTVKGSKRLSKGREKDKEKENLDPAAEPRSQNIVT